MIRKHFFILAFLFISPFAHGQSYVSGILSFGIENGLSSNEIHAIYKEPNGFLWIGAWIRDHIGWRHSGHITKYSELNGVLRDRFNMVDYYLESYRKVSLKMQDVRPFQLSLWFLLVGSAILSTGIWFFIRRGIQVDHLNQGKLLLRQVFNKYPPSLEEDLQVQVVSPQTLADQVWIKKVENILHRELRNNQFKMEDLAYELCMSYSTMHRHMKQKTGLTPNRYFRLIRLHRAKVLLENEKVSTIKEVAYSVGFDGQTHFKNVFEAEFGERPQDYFRPSEN